MSIALVSSFGQVTNAGATTPLGATTQAGDLILVFAAGGSSDPGTPTGFTRLRIDSTTIWTSVYYRVAAAGETVVPAFSIAVYSIGAVYRPSSGNMAIGATGFLEVTSGTSIAMPSLTCQNTDGSSWVAGFAGYSGNGTLTLPANLTLRGSGATQFRLGDTNAGVVSYAGGNATATTTAFLRAYVVEIRTLGQPQHLASDNTAQATATAGLRVAHHLAAAAQAFATSTAAVRLQEHLATAATALASSTAGLRDTKHLAAAITAVASASAILGVHKSLGASLADIATGTGTLDVQKHLVAAAAAVAAVTANLRTAGGIQHLATDAKAQATSSANLRVTHHLADAATAIASATASLREIKELVAAATAEATAGDVTLRQRVHLGANAESRATGDAALRAAHSPVIPEKSTVTNVEVSWQSVVSRADPSQGEANRRELEYPFGRPGRKFYGDPARRGAYN